MLQSIRDEHVSCTVILDMLRDRHPPLSAVLQFGVGKSV